MLINVLALAALVLTNTHTSSALVGMSISMPSSPISLFSTKGVLDPPLPWNQIQENVTRHVDVSQYRQVKVQIIYDPQMRPDRFLLYLFSLTGHGFKMAKIGVNSGNFEQNYSLNNDDLAQQPGPEIAACPDPLVQFIAFAPNNVPCEQQAAMAVANAAEARGLKTVRLLIKNATSENYINYMVCPKLKGIFYDGDGDPQAITTSDGIISSRDMSQEQFNYNVTNIWVACEAFNNPMKTAVMTRAKSQKYAAGINDLYIGPSDDAASCAMIAALDGEPMTSAFWDCYKKLDIPADLWGFAGNGSDFFGR